MIILANKQDESKIVEEERQIWLNKVLVALGADKNIINKNNLDAKNYILSLNLDVIMKPEGEIDIIRYEYDGDIEKDSYLVAQWFKPIFILINNKGKKYYEIHIEEWALPFQMVK